MSTTVIPDIYRHTARKSTVSRNVKPSSKNLSLSNPSFTIDKNTKEEQSIFDTIECDIKLEKDIPQQEQSFVIIHDNEIEQMNIEQTNDEIICDIIEQIKNQIQNTNLQPIHSTDIHHVIDSMIDHIDENDQEKNMNTTTNDVHMDDESKSLNEEVSMDSSQQSSVLSRSQMDDDIVEIEASASNIQSPLCTCQCHQSTSNSLLTNPSNEYFLFEQALRQTRQEHEQSFNNNNHLIQTLKRQHRELVDLYQRQISISKIDREQQTIHINQHDSQIQTDVTTATTTTQQNCKSTIHQVNGTHSTPNSKGPTLVASRPFNSFLTPIRTTGPSLQQLIPCLTTTTTATTASLTNKTTIIKKTPAITTPSPQPPPPLSSAAANSHDIVDLTEDDDDANKVPTNKISPIKLQPSPVSTSLPNTAVPTRNQPISRPIRPNTTTAPPGQTFPLRPLPEHYPCDHTISRPQLSITHDNTTVRLTWNLPSTPMESILSYEIYAYKQTTTLTTSDWKKIGNVNSMRLPMAVTLREFQSNSHYAFAVRAIGINNHIGPFCEPKAIYTGNTLVQSSLNTNQIIDGST